MVTEIIYIHILLTFWHSRSSFLQLIQHTKNNKSIVIDPPGKNLKEDNTVKMI